MGGRGLALPGEEGTPPHAAPAWQVAERGDVCRQSSSAEGDATAARSRARESNQNQLKTDPPFQGLPEGLSSAEAGDSSSRGVLHHAALLSPGVVGLGVGIVRRAAPRASSSRVLLMARLLLLCTCGRSQVPADCGLAPQLSLTHTHPYWSQNGAVGAFYPCFTDKDVEADRGHELLLKATKGASGGTGI